MSDKNKKESKPKPKLNFAENFALSGIAAVTSKTAAAPIERIKLMLQNQDEMLKSGRLKTPYNGVFDVTKRIMSEEGLIHFWRGNFANCLRYFPTQALNFAFKDKIKAQFKPTKQDSKLLSASKNIAAGGFAGVLSLCFVYPLDYARTRLAADSKGKGGERQFNGLGDVLIKSVKSDGAHGLYRGFVISAVGIFFYRGCYFGFFDTMSPLLGKDAGFVSKFILGYAVTVCAGLVSYPIDTVRRRMMMTSGEGVKYSGSIDCAKQVLQKEGIGSFFKGAGANVLRGAAGAGVLAGFDVFKKWYIKQRYE